MQNCMIPFFRTLNELNGDLTRQFAKAAGVKKSAFRGYGGNRPLPAFPQPRFFLWNFLIAVRYAKYREK